MDPSSTGFLDDYLPYLLRRADQALSSDFYRALTDYGVARSEWRVLAVLADLGQMSMLDLTAASLSPQPPVTHAVRRLEKRGLVERTLGTEDRRQRFVSVTPAGSQLTQTLIDEATRLEAVALESAGDLSELIAGLLRLTEVLDAGTRSQAESHPDTARPTAATTQTATAAATEE